MKAFIGAILIFLLLVGGVTANTLFMGQRLDVLLQAAIALPCDASKDATPCPEAEALLRLWEKTRPIAAVTVSSARLEKIDSALGRMKVAWDAGDDDAYREARAELVLLLSRLRAMESLSLLSIL